MKIGFLGLGNMGRNMALNLQDSEHQVFAWNRSEQKRNQASEAGLQNVYDSVGQVIESLSDQQPKVVWSMISAGPAVDQVFFENEDSLFSLLSAGDIVVDGVNSHFEDSKRRAQKFSEKGIVMLDIGVSGGVEGARHGACMMVGGEHNSFEQIEDLLRDMSVDNGYGYFGKSGAGHYVKMVHNAIEYSMMQSIAEGTNLLTLSEYSDGLDLAKVTDVWNHGSIIQSNLVGYLNKALTTNSNLDQYDAEIGSLGTGRWAVEEALKRQAPFTNIANSVFTRYQSRGAAKYLLKTVQAMRSVFGAHTSDERPQQ